eukprot:Nitzschia sp. Nitz4//scaffold196_size54656//16609//20632//NITZ4_006637-RA/size54656-snap-gene-0.31-mRNA-1//-1//CDS//3329540420//6967//frame0
MFSEEIGGNANKRRQQEAKERRRKLKEQQQRKQAEEQRKKLAASSSATIAPATAATTTTAAAAATAATAAATAVPSTLAPQQPLSIAPSAQTSQQPPKNEAVANALQQRQQRQAAQQLQKSAITMQSFIRSSLSNIRHHRQESQLLQKRITDLTTLSTILSKQSKAPFVAPCALATALFTQMAFLTTSIPYAKRPRKVVFRQPAQDILLLDKLVQLVFLPSIVSPDPATNVCVIWLTTYEGRRRLSSLLRLIWVALSHPTPNTSATNFLLLFKTLLGLEKAQPPALVQVFAWEILFPLTPPATPVTPASLPSSTLDGLARIRYHLLFVTGGSHPIPPSAERDWDACITSADRTQGDALVQFLLSVLASVQTSSNKNAFNRKELWLRFVSDILTVPLFTWKTRDATTHRLASQPPLLTDLLAHFCTHHASALSVGRILDTLHPISLTVCPATPTQCLLANILQIGKLSPLLNGSQIDKINFPASTVYFSFVATLLDAVPLATFLSRSSVVEWMSDGQGHHTPVVLSSVVLKQCHTLLVDSFLRHLFSCAIDDEALRTNQVLQAKTEKDRKHEPHESAVALAAKEARKDRTKSFWNSSVWAKKLTKGVSSMLDKGKTPKENDGGGGELMNTSAVSQQLAKGDATIKVPDTPTSKAKVRHGYSSSLLIALCKVAGVLLARWGGGGATDIVSGKPLARGDSKQGNKAEIASSSADPITQSLLNVLVFSTTFIRAAWGILQSDSSVMANVQTLVDPQKGRIPIRAYSVRPKYGSAGNVQSDNDGVAMLFVFVSTLSHILIVTDDTEIHDMEKPLPLHQLRRCIQTLKQLLYRACCLDIGSEDSGVSPITSVDSNYFGLALVAGSSRAMRDLYDRSSRRPLSTPKLWLIDDLLEREIRRCKSFDDYARLLSTPVLRVCPFLVSFKRRLKLFERIVTTKRVAIQGENSQNPFHTNPLKPGIPIRITRGRILEDGLATMNNLGSNMRQRLAVHYYNEAGMKETGIDAGGLFKEFWTDLCAIAFDPNYALFQVTNENCMYPNPSSKSAHGADHVTLFEFLGRILGKALFEGITVHPQFAHFFLSHLRGDYNYLNMLSDLSTMDSQLYNNIMFLKTYDGDAADLCLTFTVALDDFGGNREIPLIPNGSDVEVTNTNKQRYIGLVAKYYVVDRIKEQSEAFTRGLREVIDKSWLKIFNEPELQVLISGASDGRIDVDDLKSNCRYAGGFTGIDRTISRFWSVVGAMSQKEQAELLRFVTSCERPPPLGFASLNPPFTIQRIGIRRDEDQLPTSSTCFNVLKLPTYSSEKIMRDRLLLAIQSGAGFELT